MPSAAPASARPTIPITRSASGASRRGRRARELVPVGKAYSGFTDEELLRLDRWIRKHTTEQFGPVRAVEPRMVLEIAFDAVFLEPPQVGRRHALPAHSPHPLGQARRRSRHARDGPAPDRQHRGFSRNGDTAGQHLITCSATRRAGHHVTSQLSAGAENADHPAGTSPSPRLRGERWGEGWPPVRTRSPHTSPASSPSPPPLDGECSRVGRVTTTAISLEHSVLPPPLTPPRKGKGNKAGENLFLSRGVKVPQKRPYGSCKRGPAPVPTRFPFSRMADLLEAGRPRQQDINA